MRLKTIAPVTAVMLALAVPASASAATLIGSGSSVAQPVLQGLFKQYHRLHRGISFVYTPDGGNAGVKDVQQGRSQFAVNTRLPLPSDSGTSYIKAYFDGLVIGVNRRNRLSNLSIARTRNIFTGLLTNWSSIPGSGLSTTIDAVGRDSTAGTYTFFLAAVLNNKPQASTVNPLSTDGLVANAIKRDPNAIGYVGLSHSGLANGVKNLTLNGIAATARNIRRLRYPLSRFVWFVIPNSGASRNVQKFIDWARTSKDAGVVINRSGGVSAFNRTR